MRIEINVSPDIKEPYAVINTNCVTAEISGIAEALVIVLIIWYCFYRYNKNLANRMNDALKRK